MTTICAPIVARTMQDAAEQLQAAQARGADLAEWRIDMLRETPDVAGFLAASPLPLVCTCRAEREGGQYAGDEAERLGLLQQCIDAGAAYVDVEADAITHIRPGAQTRLIASRHDFDRTPEDLPAMMAQLAALPCDIIKLATMATDLSDNMRLFAAMQKSPKPVIGLCMGELGEMSRILGPRFGSLFTFGALESGQESAPGQFTVRELRELYRVPSLTESTALYGVLGNPIAHSLSPEIHNAAFASLGMDAVYLRFRVHDFDRFLREVAQPLGLQGVSVTIPHKASALAAADEVEPAAERIGAVNTLTRTEGGWHGDNTDCAAALGAIHNAAGRAGLEMKDARALLLGAGGTSRAIGVGLIEAGCKLTLANRTRSRAEALAAELGAGVIDLADAAGSPYDIVANTTSVGMHPKVDASAVEASVFRPGMVVFDAVYNPRETKLLRLAREAGAEIADGVEMFVGQAVRQFERWTRTDAPVEVMERVVTDHLAGVR